MQTVPVVGLTREDAGEFSGLSHYSSGRVVPMLAKIAAGHDPSAAFELRDALSQTMKSLRDSGMLARAEAFSGVEA